MSFNGVGLASRIKSARKNRGGTREQLSERTGLGKGLLSKVENFRVTPSLPTVAKVASALSIPLEQLFVGLTDDASICFVKRAERKEVQRNTEHSTIKYYDLAHLRGDRRMDPFELVKPAKGGSELQLYHEGEEFLTVLEGEVVFTIENEEHILEMGDSVYFSAETKHAVQNRTEHEARVICVFCR